MTLLADSKCSVDQIDGQVKPDASCNEPEEPTVQPQPQSEPQTEPQPTSGPLSPQSSVDSSQSKPVTPKRKSLKYPAPPIPSGTPASKPSSPTTPESQPAKVKYRAPLPPVQRGASTGDETSMPSSPSAGFIVNGIETSKTPTQVNGAKPHLAATNSSASLESTSTSASLQIGPTSPDRNLETVSALVSSTIQGLVSPSTLDKLTPTITTPSTSPGPNRGTNVVAITTSNDPSRDKTTPSQSPTSPNQEKSTIGSYSPSGLPGPLNKGFHLRYIKQCLDICQSVNKGHPESYCEQITPNSHKSISDTSYAAQAN